VSAIYLATTIVPQTYDLRLGDAPSKPRTGHGIIIFKMVGNDHKRFFGFINITPSPLSGYRFFLRTRKYVRIQEAENDDQCAGDRLL
jgi:hypothetical protein